MDMGKLLWFTTGATIGTAMAILLAPQSGQETREYLRKQARRGREALGEARQEVFETGRDLFERGRALADEAAAMMERGIRGLES